MRKKGEHCPNLISQAEGHTVFGREYFFFYRTWRRVDFFSNSSGSFCEDSEAGFVMAHTCNPSALEDHEFQASLDYLVRECSPNPRAWDVVEWWSICIHLAWDFKDYKVKIKGKEKKSRLDQWQVEYVFGDIMSFWGTQFICLQFKIHLLVA